MPLCPVNQRTPRLSNVAVFRFAYALRRQREASDLPRAGVDAHDRVEAAVRDPRRSVRADDDAVRCRPVAESREPRLPGPRVQPAELARVLSRVPDATVTGRRDVVRMRARRDAELADA